MRRRTLTIVVLLLLIAVAIWIDLPNNPGIKLGNFSRSLDVVLGLDLQGGLQVLLEADVPPDVTVDPQSMEDTKIILENRSNGLGVSEVTFQVAGGRRIVGEFPGLTNTEEVLAVLKETGQLEFVDLGDIYLEPGTVVNTDLQDQLAQFGKVGLETLPTVETPADPAATEVPVTDKIWHTIMTGDQLSSVIVSTDSLGQYAIDFQLKPDGTQIFGEYTTNNIGKYLAIVLDKKVISAPVINGAITEGQGQISGGFTRDSANNLAIQLRYGSLPVALTIAQTRDISPTLGQDSLQKSLIAGIVGFIIISLFMIIYYRLPGIVAVFAIITFGLFTLAVYKILPVTLTLPGIAGFLLSTGGALDANILIFERMKEELRSGRKVGQAFDLGWKRAWPSIRDSNAATLITSAILFWFGSAFGASAVRGFALTLALGVAISLFGALVVTKTYLSLTLEATKPKDLNRWFGL